MELTSPQNLLHTTIHRKKEGPLNTNAALGTITFFFRGRGTATLQKCIQSTPTGLFVVKSLASPFYRSAARSTQNGENADQSAVMTCSRSGGVSIVLSPSVQ